VTLDPELTERARALKAQGLSVRRIADELGVSKSAVQRRIKPGVPTQNFGAGHSRARHAREIGEIIAKRLGTNRESMRQAGKVVALAKECPEVFGDLPKMMNESTRVWPAYKEAMRRLDRLVMQQVMADADKPAKRKG
jgi:predicted transcriptional regulator